MLTVLYRAENKININKNGKKHINVCWRCRCDCGVEKDILASSLTYGRQKSCGCIKSKISVEVNRKYNHYDLSGIYGVGWTSNTNEEFYFDLEDYDRIKNYCWINANGYIASVTFGKYIPMHGLILNVLNEDVLVDHIGHNTMDNRKAKLRIVNKSKNGMNRMLNKNSSSGVTGVSFNKNIGKWVAYIHKESQQIYLGSFSDKEDAIKARKEAEEKYFCEYSFDNSMNKYIERFKQDGCALFTDGEE